MGFAKKSWKDRLAEFPGRRRLKNVATGEETVYDVSRNEGNIMQEGDAFSKDNMDDLEGRIEDAFVEMNSKLSNLFIVTSGSVSTGNLAVNGYFLKTISINKTGYTPFAVKQLGTSSSGVSISGWRLGNTELRLAYINVTPYVTSATIDYEIIWIKNL